MSKLRCGLFTISCLTFCLTAATAATAATWYQDLDADTFGNPGVSTEFPTQPPGYVADNTDCDDTNPNTHPGAPEMCNGEDNDCNGQADDNPVNGNYYYRDLDGDGYGDPSYPGIWACTPPLGYVNDHTDCDDTDFDINPGEQEYCDNKDNDCNSYVDDDPIDGFVWYFDNDQDSFGNPGNFVVACIQPSGTVGIDGDCDDEDPNINPNAQEVCDGEDNDCNGQIDDGLAGVPEVCNGADDNCDAQIDEGCPGFSIIDVGDVGNDQGRRVRVSWNRHGHDYPSTGETLLSYTIYRRIDANLASAPAAASASEPLMATPPGDWDFVINVPATGDDTYNALAGTLCDSTGSGICWSVYFVRGHTPDPVVFFDTPVDSGYSVDDLAPAVPQSLAVAYAATGTQLSWEDNAEDDLRYYRVYRSTDPDFVPGPGTLVHETTAPSWTDGAMPNWADMTYKVTALDFSDNESDPAEAETITGIGGGSRPLSFALHQNRPNPFSTSTNVRLDLVEGGHVTLRVYDVRGRLVRTLIDEAVPAGTRSVAWDGNNGQGQRAPVGIYLYRMDAPGYTQTLKMMLIR